EKPPELEGGVLARLRRKPKSEAVPPAPHFHPLLAVPRAQAAERAEHYPPLELLEISSEAAYAQASASQKAKTIEETLSQFGIPAKVIDTKAGPTITQFAIEPGFVERKGMDGQVQ